MFFSHIYTRNEFKYLFFFCLQICSFSTLQSINLQELKGTYDILKPEFQHCSPVHGAVWWEMELVKKYYQFGNLWEEETAHLRSGKYDLGPQVSGEKTIDLIHQLFNIVQGSFNITDNESYPAKHLMPQSIGNLLGTIKQLQDDKEIENKLQTFFTKDILFQASLAQTSVYQKLYEDELKKESENLDKIKKDKDIDEILTIKKIFDKAKIKLENEELETYLKGLEKLQAKISREQPQEGEQKTEAVKPKKATGNPKQPNLQELVEKLKTTIKNSGIVQKYKNYLIVNDKIKSIKKSLSRFNADKAKARIPFFIQALIGSLEECGFLQSDKAILFPPFTTHTILLAFLYRKANNKNELKDYFDALNIKLEGEALSGQLNANWLASAYDTKEVATIITDIKQIVETEPDPEKWIQSIPYEATTFAELAKLYMRSLPNVTEYRTTTLAEGFPQINFADCMDTTIRNIVNIICYDNKNGIFSLEGKEFKPTEELKKFYASHSSSSTIGDSKVHTAWTTVVENLPFVAYAKAISIDGKEVLPDVGSEHGYIHAFDFKILETKDIKIEEVDYEQYKKVTLDGKVYRFIDPTKYVCFELIPSIKNVIIALNHILGLNLFEGEKLEQEFISSIFNQTYFPVLCQKLGWEPEGIDTKDLDSKDYSESKNKIKITKKNAKVEISDEFFIHLSQDHGYVTAPQKSLQEPYIQKLNQTFLDRYKEDINYFFLNLNLATLYPLELQKINELKEIPIAQNHYLFLRDLLNENHRLEVVKFLFEQSDTRFYDFAAKLIESFPVNQDFYYQQTVVPYITPDAVKKSEKLKKAIQNIIEIAKNGMEKEETQYNSIYLFLPLIEIGQGFPQALEAAKKGMENKNLQNDSMGIYVLLVEKGQNFPQAIEVATKCMEKKELQYSSFLIFEALVKKNQGIEQAQAAVQKLAEGDEEQQKISNDLQALITEYNPVEAESKSPAPETTSGERIESKSPTPETAGDEATGSATSTTFTTPATTIPATTIAPAAQ